MLAPALASKKAKYRTALIILGVLAIVTTLGVAMAVREGELRRRPLNMLIGGMAAAAMPSFAIAQRYDVSPLISVACFAPFTVAGELAGLARVLVAANAVPGSAPCTQSPRSVNLLAVHALHPLFLPAAVLARLLACWVHNATDRVAKVVLALVVACFGTAFHGAAAVLGASFAMYMGATRFPFPPALLAFAVPCIIVVAGMAFLADPTWILDGERTAKLLLSAICPL
jgi:hypothetical protein